MELRNSPVIDRCSHCGRSLALLAPRFSEERVRERLYGELRRFSGGASQMRRPSTARPA